MTRLPIYQVDAFASQVFQGNPAAVMPLAQWLPDATLQALARENNLSETAFLVPEPESAKADYHIRWFTPGAEVPLCGHATLASAWVLFNRLAWPRPEIRFHSRSGALSVTRKSGSWLELDFPALDIRALPAPDPLRRALDRVPEPVYEVPRDTNLLVVLDDARAVRDLTPDLSALRELGHQGLIVTARGDDCDFVSRYFAPGVGIDEDPVTGSIHSALVPYWSERLGKQALLARQLSERGGELRCHLAGDRVRIAGQAAFYMSGEVCLD